MGDIFSNEELLNEFCRIQDREYGCKEAFGCGHPECVCPLWIAIKVANEKPTTREEVYNQTERAVRATIDEHSRERILKDNFAHPERVYPRAPILLRLEEYLLKHIVPDSAIIYWSAGEIKRIDQWVEKKHLTPTSLL